ncbi:cell growth regulator with RING finger domain protein 1 isoform X1 [Hypanus sabinus]|uniref:cell growth regulator with RING finger domain protein 1 isoform X1 n=1 Tax=Hypanus sabinus TaxID=79690 RepID=UPI0028C37802|nr:cell growth regulator with RING finger domain protein 1 isoform X1 [Hypanus sabinus]
MAAVFLVMLYEYSPLFYITLIFVCFFVTTAVIFGWFVWDIPVIIRNSEETESGPGVQRKRMIQVKNPFSLEIINSLTASVTGGIALKSNCIEKCTLTIYWGCSVHKLHEGLRKHIYCFRIKLPQKLEEAVDKEYLYREEFLYLFSFLMTRLSIEKESDDEIFPRLPEYLAIKDFGDLPRARYPLVALLTLTEEENWDIYEIISMITVIHVPDEKYKLACRILYQYLLTAQGHVYDLKRLFVSASDSSVPEEMPSEADGVDKKLLEKFGTAEEEFDLWKENSKDCVVCQNAPVNWVLLPCRHACLCDCCVTYFNRCPMCREFVCESFALKSSGVRTEENIDVVENEADDPLLGDI